MSRRSLSRRDLVVGLLLLLTWLLAACEGDLIPVPNTTVRVSHPTQPEGTELDLRIFTTRDNCGRLKPEDQPLCLPWVDRHSGEVHLSYQFFLGSEPWPMPVSKEHMVITHQGSIIQEGQNKQSYDIIPHDPIRSPQLFVLVIDGSASMNLPENNPRIERVRQVLLLPEVIDAFFPEEVRTGVVLLEFMGDQMVPLGGKVKVIQQRKEYKELVRKELRSGTGFTFLYNAIRYATGPLLTDDKAVAEFLQAASAAPTVIVLTDGFNNERGEDRCTDNADRLELLLKHLREVRGPEVDLRVRPQVYTVGLGRSFRPRFKLPDDYAKKVRPIDLCTRRYKDYLINGSLETVGIDNASLAWIGGVGGGTTYVKNDASGLGEAFRAAAAARYEWFEARYRLDPFYLRRSFKTTLRLVAFATAEASVVIHPSAWLDAPPGLRGPDGWTRPASLAQTTVLLMPVLGTLVLLGFLSPALYNTRRFVFGRLRPPKARPAPKPPPPTASP